MAQRPQMHTPGIGGPAGGEKSLDYSDEKTPPGWMPGIANYPFVQYQKKLELWIMRYRLASLPREQEAPAMASRLHGQPWEIAMKLRIPKSVAEGGPRPGAGVTTPAPTPDQFHVGPNALIQPEVAEDRHGVTGAVIQERIPSGLQTLWKALETRYGLEVTEQAPIYLDLFFDFRRRSLSLQDYVLGFQQAYEEANAHCGLHINDIGLSHWFLKYSGISQATFMTTSCSLEEICPSTKNLRT